jgi:hypothetical protein
VAPTNEEEKEVLYLAGITTQPGVNVAAGFFALALASDRSGAVAGTGYGIIAGVNVGTGDRSVYASIPIATTLGDVQATGCPWVRAGWNDDTPMSQIDTFMATAQTNGQRVLAGIFPVLVYNNPGATPAQIEQAAYQSGYTLAARYPQQSIWEMSNEMSNFAILQPGDIDPSTGKLYAYAGSPDGNQVLDYEATRLAQSVAIIRGLSNGIHAANPTALRVFCGETWLHWGFLDACIQGGVNYDIISWHWYSDMGNITQATGSSGTYNVIQQLASYGKPIWISEFSRANGSMGGHDTAQAQYLHDVMLQYLSLSPVVGALFTYELYDEPDQSGGEAWFGLKKVIGKNPWSPGVPKAAWTTYRQRVQFMQGSLP